MRSAKDTVEQYLTAFYAGDRDTARRLLADHLVFSGPSASFSSAEAFLRASAHVGTSVQAVQTHRLFVDGQDVGIFYELVLDQAPGVISVADWYHLEGEQIASIRTILDTAPFTVGGRQRTGETAVDPVCHMTVQKASPAAIRSHADTIYYFCNRGCAEAFEKEPDAYLATSHGEGP